MRILGAGLPGVNAHFVKAPAEYGDDPVRRDGAKRVDRTAPEFTQFGLPFAAVHPFAFVSA